jgi:predicted nuclease of predicted toxin-antitoxin system
VLLFDENISFRLTEALRETYPGCTHVRHAGLAKATDTAIWAFAKERRLAIVSKDQDFRQRALLYGPPPQCIWVCVGNCSTADLYALLQKRQSAIRGFAESNGSLLILSKAALLMV